MASSDLTKEAQGIRLVAPFLALTSQRQRVLGEGVCLLQVAGQHLRLPEGEPAKLLPGYECPRSGLLQRLREQRHSVSNAPGQRVRRTQRRRQPGEKGPE